MDKSKTKNDVLLERVESLISEIEDTEKEHILKIKRTIHVVSCNTELGLTKNYQNRFKTAEHIISNSLSLLETAKGQLAEVHDVLMSVWYKEHREEINQQLSKGV